LTKHPEIATYHFGRGGGWVPSTQDVYRELVRIYETSDP